MLELDTTQKVLSFGPEIEARSDLLVCLKIKIRKQLKIKQSPVLLFYLSRFSANVTHHTPGIGVSTCPETSPITPPHEALDTAPPRDFSSRLLARTSEECISKK